MGIIRECGGKMHMSEGKQDPEYVGHGPLIFIAENWKEAQSDFFESFRNYDEAGSLQRIQVLKYLVLTTMLMKSDINPFDSQETKPYKTDSRISAMTDLVDAYQRNDIHKYEAILRDNQDVLADPFIAENIDEVSRNMRTKAVLKIIAPYTRFTLAFIAKKVNISIPEVQDILGFLIMDKKLDAKIDQENGTVLVEGRNDVDRIKPMQEWTEAVGTLWRSILNEGEGFKSDDSPQLISSTSLAPSSNGHGMGSRTIGGVDPRKKFALKGKAAGGRFV
jgi:COP9 signalosome complex subunit 2